MSLLQTLIIFFGILNLTFGAFLYLNSKRSLIVQLYSLIFTFATLWSLSTFFTSAGNLSLDYFKLALYGHYIFGYLAYLAFFWFALYYPTGSGKSRLPAVLLSVITVGYLTLIPTTGLMFANISVGSSLNSSVEFNLSGYIGFIVMLSLVFFTGLFILLQTKRSFDTATLYKDLDRYQINIAIIANFVAGILGIVFNLIFPLFGNYSFFYINPILVTAALTGLGLYNILRYNFFNSRIVLSEFFTGGILILSLTRFILSPSGTERILDGILLVIMAAFGAFLMQSIFREITLRSRLEERDRELELSNRQQESLLHFISHEIKGYLAKSEAAFAAIIEGDYGRVDDRLKTMANMALADVRKGVTTVMDILDASNLKKGTVAFNKERFDLERVLSALVEEMRPAAVEKGLAVSLKTPGSPLEILGDKDKLLNHVVRNLIDNAIKYTPLGAVAVELAKDGNTVRFSVRDNGVGISEEDKQRLFTEGGRGKDSLKVNVHSTGYGLYIAKQIVEAHGGTIRAESEGAGKGSTFIVELPAT